MKTLGTIIRVIGCIWLAVGLFLLVVFLFTAGGRDTGRYMPTGLVNIGLAFGAFSLGTWLRNMKPFFRANTRNDEPLWQIALAEFEGNSRRPGLWAQSFSEARGNDGAAQAIYLRRRVIELQREDQTGKRDGPPMVREEVAGQNVTTNAATKLLSKSFARRHQ